MPYQPNIEYRGDQYLFQGISQAGDAVKGAIKQWKDERKDAKATAKTLEAVGSGLSGLVEAGLLPPGMLKQYAQVQGAPASEQKAFLQGTGEVFRMFQQMEQTKSEAAKLKMAAERLDEEKKSRLGLEKYRDTETEIAKEKLAMAKAEDAKQQAFGGRLQQLIKGTPTLTQYPSVVGDKSYRNAVPGRTGAPVTTPAVPGRTASPALAMQAAAETGTLTPRDAMSMGTTEQFVPQGFNVELPDGKKVPMLSTSRNSAVPLSDKARSGGKTYALLQTMKARLFNSRSALGLGPEDKAKLDAEIALLDEELKKLEEENSSSGSTINYKADGTRY